MRNTGPMSSNDTHIDEIAAALEMARGREPLEALPHLRRAAELVTALIDQKLAEAVLHDSASLRAAGASAGLSENAVGPRLARTAALESYASSDGRVTAAGVERARYDLESGRAPGSAASSKPLRFKPRRSSR